MLRLLLWGLLAVLIFVGTPVTESFASEGGDINIGGDPCFPFIDDTAGVITLTVVHEAHLFPVVGYAKGSRFKIVLGPGITWTQISFHTYGHSFTGDPYTGITIDYLNGGCAANLPDAILELTFFSVATTVPGSEISVVPFPGEPSVQSRTCLDQWVPAGAWSEFVNGGPCVDPGPIPVAEETWGAIKALYR